MHGIKAVLLLLFATFGVQSSDDEGSLLVLLARTASTQLQPTGCVNHLRVLLSAWENEQMWAIKLVDASGRIPSGFVWGNNFMLGSKSACDLMHVDPASVVLSDRYHRVSNTSALLASFPSEFETSYAVVYARHLSRDQIDIGTFEMHLQWAGAAKAGTRECSGSPSLSIRRMNLTVLHSKTPQLTSEFIDDPSVRAFLALLLLQVVLILAGTFLKLPKTHSWTLNKSRLVQESKEDPRLRCIYGIKVLSMLWIVNGHITFYSLPSMENPAMILPLMTQLDLQPVFASATIVDTFFAISGFLTAFLFQQQKQKGIFLVLKGVLGKFLKFTPSYAVAILMAIAASKYLKDASPYWLLENDELNCKQHWWRNLLYINNLYPMREICMSWTWYLSVDFQCFIFGVVLLVLFQRYKSVVLIVGFLVLMHSAVSIMMAGVVEKYTIALDVMFQTRDQFYIPTSGRLGVYITALTMGYWYGSQSTLRLPKGLVLLLTMLSMALQVVLVHSQVIRGESIYGPFTLGLGRVLWSWSICWMIIACSTPYGAKMGRFFEDHRFVVLGRLTFAVYLINPIVVQWISMHLENPFYLGWTFSALIITSYSVIIYLAALLFKLVVEEPFSQTVRWAMELGTGRRASKPDEALSGLEDIQKCINA